MVPFCGSTENVRFNVLNQVDRLAIILTSSALYSGFRKDSFAVGRISPLPFIVT